MLALTKPATHSLHTWCADEHEIELSGATASMHMTQDGSSVHSRQAGWQSAQSHAFVVEMFMLQALVGRGVVWLFRGAAA